MGARESVPQRSTAEALSHARGRAGARARDVRPSCTARDRDINALDAVAKRRREAHYRRHLIFAFIFLSFDPGRPLWGQTGAKQGQRFASAVTRRARGGSAPRSILPPKALQHFAPREPSPFGSSDDGGGCQGGGFQRGRARRGEGWRGACLCPCFAGRAGVKSCRRVCGAIHPASPEASSIPCPCHWHCAVTVPHASRCHSRSFSLGWHLLCTSFRSVIVTDV
jgi:hypothetical protein